jgi:hypothetical protein
MLLIYDTTWYPKLAQNMLWSKFIPLRNLVLMFLFESEPEIRKQRADTNQTVCSMYGVRTAVYDQIQDYIPYTPYHILHNSGFVRRIHTKGIRQNIDFVLKNTDTLSL